MEPDVLPAGEARPGDDDLLAWAMAMLDGDAEAEDRLARGLHSYAKLTATTFLQSRDHPDVDDLSQEAVLAVLDYLRRRGGFIGSLSRFTITVTRNRGRNWVLWRRRHPHAPLDDHAKWLADPDSSALDLLEEDESRRLVRRALARLGPVCHALLRGLFLEGRTIEEMRRRAGLTTKQAIYHRRAQCLKKAGELLKARLSDCSFADEGDHGDQWGNPSRGGQGS